MANIDDRAIREAIRSAQGGDEVWTVERVYTGEGKEGTLRVELLHHPEFGYMVTAEDEGGNKITSNNPTPDPVDAVRLAHWANVRRSS